MKLNDPEEVIPVLQASRETGLAVTTLRTVIRVGKIPLQPEQPRMTEGPGRPAWYIKRGDLDRYIRNRASRAHPKAIKDTYVPSLGE